MQYADETENMPTDYSTRLV